MFCQPRRTIILPFTPRCKDGYGLASQTASLSCQSDGTWSKSSIKCQPNPCTLPSSLSAPHVIFTGKELTPVGGTITFSCPPGLHLQGSAIAECQVIHLPPVNHLSNSCYFSFAFRLYCANLLGVTMSCCQSFFDN